MIRIGNKRYSLIILYAIGLHYIAGITLLADPQAINATTLAIFHNAFGITPTLLAVFFWLASSLALSSLLLPLGPLSVPMMLPQQTILMVSAFGALAAMAVGQYGDGVPRPSMFIIADQSPALLTALGHTLAIIGRINELNGFE